MRIEIFGPGCTKCEKTSREVEKVVRHLGVDATVEHVTDMDSIVNRGVLLTPQGTTRVWVAVPEGWGAY